MIREQILNRLAMAETVAESPATVLCIEPFASVERDGGEHLGKLLAHVMREPNQSQIVATEDAFIFSFGDQLGGCRGDVLQDYEEPPPRSNRPRTNRRRR